MNKSSAVATQTYDLDKLSIDYASAWVALDLERIMSFHADDTLFRMDIAGWPTAHGKSAVEEKFGLILDMIENQTFDLRRKHIVDNVLIWELSITGTFVKPLVLGDKEFLPTGQLYESTLVDFITWEDGLIKSKETWLDVMAWLNSLKSS